jgi:hypothetical protein
MPNKSSIARVRKDVKYLANKMRSFGLGILNFTFFTLIGKSNTKVLVVGCFHIYEMEFCRLIEAFVL